MPRITTHAIPLETVQRASGPMAADLARLLDIPEEYVVLEVRRDAFVARGAVVEGDPFVEVALFDRGEAMDAVARTITAHLQAAGCPHLDLYLHVMPKPRYYEDGVPF